MKFFAYRVEIDDKNADEIDTKLDDDLVKIEWFDIKDLKDYKFTPPSIRLSNKLNYLK